jgi:hypothetical protein
MRIAEKITILLTVILIALLGYNMISPKASDKLQIQQIKLMQQQNRQLDSIINKLKVISSIQKQENAYLDIESQLLENININTEKIAQSENENVYQNMLMIKLLSNIDIEVTK